MNYYKTPWTYSLSKRPSFLNNRKFSNHISYPAFLLKIENFDYKIFGTLRESISRGYPFLLLL